MLPEQIFAQASSKLPARIRLPVHHSVFEALILENTILTSTINPQSTVNYLNNEGNFRVPLADQRAIVDVGRPANYHFVIDDHKFWVNVDEFCDWFWVETRVSSESVETDIIRRVGHPSALQSVQNCVSATAIISQKALKITISFSFDFLKMF